MKISRYIINPFTLAVTYLVIGSLWVAYSDNIVANIINNPGLILRYQTVKGLLFVTLSSVLFYLFAKISERSLMNVNNNLEREKLKLKGITEASPVSIIFVEPNGQIRYANEVAENLFNMRVDTLIARKFDELGLNIKTKNGEEVLSKNFSLNAVLRTQKAISGKVYRVGDEGDYKYISINASPIFLENKELDGIVCAIMDITDIIESKNLIQEHEERYNLLVDESPFALVIHQNNIIQYINPMGLKLLEAENKEQIIGLNLFETLHADYLELALEREEKFQRGEKIQYPIESKIKTFKGKVIPVEFISIPFKTGNTMARQVIAIDISERLEKERVLEESLREKTVMLSEIHHRVKNNMAIISGLIQLEAFEIKDEKLQGVLHDSVARIKSIALMHEQAYKSNNMAIVRLDKNIEELVQNIAVNYYKQNNLDIEYHLEPIVLNINQAVSCALFINEVTTNLYKYTSQDEHRAKCVVYCSHKNNIISIIFKISGVHALKESFESDETRLNTQLIQLMAQQVHGTLKIEESNNELLIELNFEKKMSAKGSAQNNAF